MRTSGSFLELKDGHFVLPKGVRIKHPLVTKYYSRMRFKDNPEVVCRILDDVPEMRQYINEGFYRGWKKMLERSSSIKRSETFSFNYDFRVEPYQHQKLAIAWCMSLPTCFLAAGTGTGKTFVGSVLTDMRLQRGTIKRALIICPKAVVRSWYKSFQDFTHSGDKVIIAHNYLGNIRVPDEGWKKYKKAEDKVYAEEYSIVITTPGTFSKKRNHFYNAGFDQVILDESTMIGNGSKAAKAIIKLRDYVPFRLAFSATPGDVEKIYNQFQLLDNPFPCSTLTGFREMFMNQLPRNPHIYIPSHNSRERVADIIKDRLLFIDKEKCLDLPPRVIKEVYVEPGSKIKKKYRQLLKEYFVMINDKELTVNSRLSHIIKLRQIMNGFCIIDGELEKIDDNPAKLRETKKIVDSLDHPCIIWAWFKEDFRMLKEALKEYNPSVVNGETSDIEAELDKVRSGESKVLIAHQASMQYGVSLNEAPTMIFYTPHYGEIGYNQAKARNRRLGSSAKQITEYRVTSGGIEDLIWKSIDEKTSFTDNILERASELAI